MNWILAGDIGGTNTRLAYFQAERPGELLGMRVYPSVGFGSLVEILARYAADLAAGGEGEALADIRPGRAGFGIAGPVDREIVKLTNLPWAVDTRAVRAHLGLENVCFVNDFAANCHAVPHLTAGHLHAIGGGSPQPGGSMAVLGAGTGLGQGFLVPRPGSGYLVVPSEGGHTDFAPRTPREGRLLNHLAGQYGRASWERVLSGAGLHNLYRFLRDGEGMAETPAIAGEMAGHDPAAVITAHALAGDDPLCRETLALFCALYGAEAGNLALKVLARGGVYLAGGIAGRILPLLEAGEFRAAFQAKGRYTALMESIPTYLITHPQPGLLGAAIAAGEM